jgi:hypothetical protein
MFKNNMFAISTVLQSEPEYIQRRIKRLISNLNKWLRSQRYPVVQNNDMTTYLALHFIADPRNYNSPSASAIAISIFSTLTMRYISSTATSLLTYGPRRSFLFGHY